MRCSLPLGSWHDKLRNCQIQEDRISTFMPLERSVLTSSHDIYMTIEGEQTPEWVSVGAQKSWGINAGTPC